MTTNKPKLATNTMLVFVIIVVIAAIIGYLIGQMNTSGTVGERIIIDGGGKTCKPKTCSQLGKSCGSWSNGCGRTINCGTCPTGQTCSGGTCITPCTKKTCSSYPGKCGSLSNGCGGRITCNCPTGQTCSGGTCITTCTPSCAGKNCGSDGCGGSCGTCPSGQYCIGFQCTTNTTA